MADREVEKLVQTATSMDPQTQLQIEAAAFRKLREHLIEKRPDVQNIDIMNLAGFCRNCLGKWYQQAANDHGIAMTKEEGREAFYGYVVGMSSQ